MKSLIVLAIMATLFAGCLSGDESPQLGSSEVFGRLVQEGYVVVSLEAIELAGQEITADFDVGHGVATAFRDAAAGDGLSGSWFARVHGDTHEPRDLRLLQILPNEIIELNQSLPLAPFTVYRPEGFERQGINSSEAMQLAPFTDDVESGHYSYRWYGDIEGGTGFSFRIFPVWALKWTAENPQSFKIDAETGNILSSGSDIQRTTLLDEEIEYMDALGNVSGGISVPFNVPKYGTELIVEINSGFSITGQNGYLGNYQITDPSGNQIQPTDEGETGAWAYFRIIDPEPGNWTVVESHDVPRPNGTSFHVDATLKHY